jgi:hypothetical protein
VETIFEGGDGVAVAVTAVPNVLRANVNETPTAHLPMRDRTS